MGGSNGEQVTLTLKPTGQEDLNHGVDGFHGERRLGKGNSYRRQQRERRREGMPFSFCGKALRRTTRRTGRTRSLNRDGWGGICRKEAQKAQKGAGTLRQKYGDRKIGDGRVARE